MTNIEGVSRGLINLYDLNGSNGLGNHYLEEWTPGVTFLDFFLKRVKMVKGLDHVVAYLHPNFARLAPVLESYEIQPIILPDLSPYATVHPRVIASRKWSYQTWKGCPFEYTIFDEIVAMGFMGHFKDLTKPAKMAYFTPEAPFFTPQATDVFLQNLGSEVEQKPMQILCQPTPLGLSSFCIGPKAMEGLSSSSVWLPKDYLSAPYPKDTITIRHMLGLPFVPNDRRNFLLRSRRDLERLRRWNGKFDAIEELQTSPREIQLEVTSIPHHSNCRLPVLSSRADMPPAQVEQLLGQICEIDDALLTIGDLGNLHSYAHYRELRDLLRQQKPYGSHVILDGAKALADLDDLNLWLDMGVDIVTLRLTSLGYKNEDLVAWEPVIAELSQRYQNPHYATIINLEVFKFHDNWRQIEVLQRWKEKYKMPFSWVSFNSYAGQNQHPVNLPEYYPRAEGRCQKLIHQMHILPNGDVTPCRQDFWGQTIVANVFASSLLEAWNSPALSEIRKNNAVGGCPTELCKNCHQGFYV